MESVIKKANEYTAVNPIRMHMPGHKGRLPKDLTLSALDLTELDATYNIYEPENYALFKKIGKLFGSEMSLFSCGGATLAIQAALFTVARGKKVICGSAHKNVFYAMALCGCEPIFFNPESDSLEKIEKLIVSEMPSAVFVTSEDYYGRIFPDKLKCIAEAAKKYDIPLICDNAHGSHLAFWNAGTLHPLKVGAEIVIDSAHKTMPVLTGGAFLQLSGKYAACYNDFLTAFKIFGSSSPSFLIAQSLEYGAFYMAENNIELNELYRKISECKTELEEAGYNFYLSSDPFRLTPIAKNAKEIDAFLAKKHIISEFSDKNHIVLIPSIMNTFDEIDSVKKALLSAKLIPIEKSMLKAEKNLSGIIMPIREAVLAESEIVSAADAIGRISAEAVYSYPPAVPFIVPGQLIEAETLKKCDIYKIKVVKK